MVDTRALGQSMFDIPVFNYATQEFDRVEIATQWDWGNASASWSNGYTATAAWAWVVLQKLVLLEQRLIGLYSAESDQSTSNATGTFESDKLIVAVALEVTKVSPASDWIGGDTPLVQIGRFAFGTEDGYYEQPIFVQTQKAILTPQMFKCRQFSWWFRPGTEVVFHVRTLEENDETIRVGHRYATEPNYAYFGQYTMSPHLVDFPTEPLSSDGGSGLILPPHAP
jgi:hypothetical protein